MQRTEIIHAAQMRLLYANAAGFVATGLNVVLLALIQWPVIAPPRLVIWLAAMLALTALRAVMVWRFQRRAPAPPAVRRWGTLFGLGTLGAGLGWGCAGVWLFPVASLPHQVFLAFVVGGMIAGAVGLLAARMGVFLSFACPAAVPIIVHLLVQDDPMSRTMSGMATLFTLVSIFTAWKLHDTIRTSLHLRFDNADLVAAVTAEKARVDASQRLETEAEQRRREAEVLAELARTVNAALEVDTVLQRVTDGARELCNSDGAAIALGEPRGDAAVICYWAGRSYRGFQGVRIEPGEGIGGLVLATGRPYRTDDYGHDPRLSQAYRAVTQAGGRSPCWWCRFAAVSVLRAYSTWAQHGRVRSPTMRRPSCNGWPTMPRLPCTMRVSMPPLSSAGRPRKVWPKSAISSPNRWTPRRSVSGSWSMSAGSCRHGRPPCISSSPPQGCWSPSPQRTTSEPLRCHGARCLPGWVRWGWPSVPANPWSRPTSSPIRASRSRPPSAPASSQPPSAPCWPCHSYATAG